MRESPPGGPERRAIQTFADQMPAEYRLQVTEKLRRVFS